MRDQLANCAHELRRLPQALQTWADTSLQDTLAHGDSLVDSDVRRMIAAVISTDIDAVARAAGEEAERAAVATSGGGGLY